MNELDDLAENPDLWSNPQEAQKVMQERDVLKTSFDRISLIQQELDEAVTFIDLGEMEEDPHTLKEGESALAGLAKRCERMRLESLLSGEADANHCFLEIHAGAGGTEAQDWALMIQRMYLRWAERNNYKIEWMSEVSGEEAGIKSSTFKVIGHQAYGWLKTENGIHRLVRISPFDSNSRRHTSFASVSIYPVRKRYAYRYVQGFGGWGAACEYNGQCRAHHPYCNKCCGAVSESTFSA